MRLASKNNRRMDEDPDRRRLLVWVVGLGALFWLFVWAGGDSAEHPCDVLRVECQELLRADFASARSLACTGALTRLVVVATDDDDGYARSQCERMSEWVQKVDDAKLSGRQQTRQWLKRIQSSIGDRKAASGGEGPLKLQSLEGEWFNARGGARRLRLRGVLVHVGTQDDIKGIACESTAKLTLKEATESRTVSDSLCHVDYFPVGAQVTFSSEAAIIVGRDEMGHGVASVLLSIQVSGTRPTGKETVTSLVEIPVPPPTERTAFTIDLPATGESTEP